MFNQNHDKPLNSKQQVYHDLASTTNPIPIGGTVPVRMPHRDRDTRAVPMRDEIDQKVREILKKLQIAAIRWDQKCGGFGDEPRGVPDASSPCASQWHSILTGFLNSISWFREGEAPAEPWVLGRSLALPFSESCNII